MGIYVTGDIHGDPTRFSSGAFYEQKEFGGNKEDNTVIICGDAGLVWNRDGENRHEKWWLDWLEEKPFTTVFCDGNHENHWRLAEYPVKEWHGGLVHEIRPHVLHLMRGEVFTIEDKKFFSFGGASSHDIRDGILDPNDFATHDAFMNTWKKWDKDRFKLFRVLGYSWWAEELPSKEEMDNAIKNMEKHNWKVDYIITHSPPASVIALLGHGLYEQDILTKFLEELRGRTEFKRHFMGHMHVDHAMNEKDVLLYEQIVRIC